MALLKFSLKTNIVKSIFSGVFAKTSSYYYAYGQVTPWPTVLDPISGDVISSEIYTPLPVESQAFEIETRKNIVYMKLIDSNDAAIVVRRINWIIGNVYDMYDDYSPSNLATSGATSLQTADYYVMTSDYNVYKCLDNNKGAQSFIQPIGTSVTQFQTSDGYVWKFMYTIPLYLRQKFLNSLWMPVTTALSNQFYSSGSINNYYIADAGSGYVDATWKVKYINILNGGAGYATGDVITFDAPTSGTTAEAIITADPILGNVTGITITIPGAGYTTQPEIASITIAGNPLIASGGTNFLYSIDYEKDTDTVGSEWTEVVVYGDGYNEESPFSLKGTSITPIAVGSFVAPVTGDIFLFPEPEKSYGRKPILEPVFTDMTTHYEITSVTIVDPGFGYIVPLVFGVNVFAPALTSGGFMCSLGTPAQQKNNAEIIPGIGDNGTLRNLWMQDNGIGYTFAYLDVKLYKRIAADTVVEINQAATSGPTYKAGFRKALVGVSFSIGNIETKQSTVELLAVNGSIPIIVVENGGAGYQSTDVITAIGDGRDFLAYPVVGTGGAISRIDIINQGSDYTQASFVIGNGTNTTATLRPIISPTGGHGKDAVSELSAHTIMLTGRLGLEKIHQTDFNDPVDPLYYRQISMLRDPYKFGSTLFYKSSTGSTTLLIRCAKTGNDWYSDLSVGTILYLSTDSTKTYTVVGKDDSDANKYAMIVTMNNSHVPVPGSVLSFTSGVTTHSFNATEITSPDVDKFTGELMYIDNREKFVPTSEQTIITSTLISF